MLALVLAVAAGCSGGPKHVGTTSLDRAAYDPVDVALAGMSVEVPLGVTNGLGAPRDMRVASMNMSRRYRPHDLQFFAEYLDAGCEAMPDFILLQEVSFRRDREDASAVTLAKELEMHCRATRRYSDREGLGIVSRYPFDYYADRQLQARTNAVMLGHGRASVMGEFIVPEVGRVRVVNVHLANWGWESHIRQRQIQETLDWIAERDRDVPAAITFFGGDFNSPPGSDAIAAVTRSGGADHLRFEDHNSEVSTRGGKRAKNRIDYIFVAAPGREVDLIEELVLDELHLDDGQIVDFWVSNHAPLVHAYAVETPADLAP